MPNQRQEDELLGGFVPLFVTVGVLTVVAFLATAFTDDPAFRFHGYVFLAAGIVALAALTLGLGNGWFKSDPGRYSDGVIRAGVIATMFWGVVGMTVGVFIASQLSWPNLLYFPDHGWLNFGRLRPLHTSGVIFAFGGNALICTSFWVVQRTCRARLRSFCCAISAI